ncbi:hypothetical protein EV182_001551 [Spiromyces aspiralis]|uniref:Uncharacterized protein n=1 Tax=Spiromyces aspiralis TaxID=68401 RepID=A0ACC1HG16_9FUNG|nr:hypothetical protein EV182_001551 [Spiromyces aspiralis]
MSQSLERKPVSTPRLVHMGPGGGHRRTPPSPEMLSRDDEQHIMGATSALISALWSVRAIDRTIELPMIELPYQVPSESEQLQFGIGPKDAWFLLTTTSLWLYAHAAFAGNIGRPLARRCGLTSFEHQQLFGMHLFNTIHCLALTVFAWRPGTKLLRFAWNAVLALALFLSLLVGKIKLCYLIACLVNVELLAFSLLGCLRMLSDAKLLVVALLVALTVTDAIVSSVVSLALGSVALMSPGHFSHSAGHRE